MCSHLFVFLQLLQFVWIENRGNTSVSVLTIFYFTNHYTTINTKEELWNR